MVYILLGVYFTIVQPFVFFVILFFSSEKFCISEKFNKLVLFLKNKILAQRKIFIRR